MPPVPPWVERGGETRPPEACTHGPDGAVPCPPSHPARRGFRPRDLLQSVHRAVGFVVVSWVIGVVGFRWAAGMSWLDAAENASLILSGMGPVASPPGQGAKVFMSVYSMFAGLFFIVIIAAVVDKLLAHPREARAAGLNPVWA